MVYMKHNLKDKVDSDEVCEGCGKDLTFVCVYEVKQVPDVLLCPFFCKVCGLIKFPIQAISDHVYVWPIPKNIKQATSSIIELPESVNRPEDELTGRSPFGVVLTSGPGFLKNGKEVVQTTLHPGTVVIYDHLLPNLQYLAGVDGREHGVVMCGYLDIKVVVDLDRDEYTQSPKVVV